MVVVQFQMEGECKLQGGVALRGPVKQQGRKEMMAVWGVLN